MVARDTGFQVIHYVGCTLTAGQFGAAQGVLLGDLPVGAVITDLDLTVLQAFGAGVQLAIARTPLGAPLTTFNLNTIGKLKLVNAVTPITPAVFGQGGQFYVYLTGSPTLGASAFVVLSYAPRLG